jgi:hypothetical protein
MQGTFPENFIKIALLVPKISFLQDKKTTICEKGD